MSGHDYTPRTATFCFSMGERQIHTTVTNDPVAIAQWVRDVRSRTYRRGLVVRLDFEWLPRASPGGGDQSPMPATIQLCVGTKCLIVQLLHLTASRYLRKFLRSPDATFVGAGIADVIAELFDVHGFVVGGRQYDLGRFAEFKIGCEEYKHSVLKGLIALGILGYLELSNPRRIMMSDWSVVRLSEEQARCASADAYFSFALGMTLMGRDWRW